MKAQLDQLLKASREELTELWQQEFGRPIPYKSRPELLRQILAWHLQVKAYGGLSAAERRQLTGNAAPALAPGSRLVRVWQGETHQVAVLDKGFMYAGKRYTSLSSIARAITGTAWSGPVFFGLKRPGS